MKANQDRNALKTYFEDIRDMIKKYKDFVTVTAKNFPTKMNTTMIELLGSKIIREYDTRSAEFFLTSNQAKELVNSLHDNTTFDFNTVDPKDYYLYSNALKNIAIINLSRGYVFGELCGSSFEDIAVCLSGQLEAHLWGLAQGVSKK